MRETDADLFAQAKNFQYVASEWYQAFVAAGQAVVDESEFEDDAEFDEEAYKTNNELVAIMMSAPGRCILASSFAIEHSITRKPAYEPGILARFIGNQPPEDQGIPIIRESLRQILTVASHDVNIKYIHDAIRRSLRERSAEIARGIDRLRAAGEDTQAELFKNKLLLTV